MDELRRLHRWMLTTRLTEEKLVSLLASEPLKKQRALQLVEQALASHQGCTSYQVIQEFANVATRKFAQRFSNEQCKQFIDAAMQPLNRVASSPELLNAALDLQADTRYSFYDCLVIVRQQHAWGVTGLEMALTRHGATWWGPTGWTAPRWCPWPWSSSTTSPTVR